MITLSRRAQAIHGEFVKIDGEWQEKLAAIGIKSGLHWLALEDGDVVATGGVKRSVNRCYRITLDCGQVIYFKRYFYRKPKPQFWMMPSKAVIEAWGYQQLRGMELTTPDVIAYGEFRKFGRLYSAFIVSLEVPNTVDMEQFARDTWYDMPEPKRSQTYLQISESILKQLKIAHENNFCHKDLKWRNILIQESPGGYTTTWIDCPRASIMRFRTKRKILLDIGALARLAMSYIPVREQFRWLQRYVEVTQCPYTARELFTATQRFLRSRQPKPLPVTKKHITRNG